MIVSATFSTTQMVELMKTLELVESVRNERSGVRRVRLIFRVDPTGAAPPPAPGTRPMSVTHSKEEQFELTLETDCLRVGDDAAPAPGGAA
jgi:hypothetical protein